MKCYIDKKGSLQIIPEEPTEDYALRKWYAENRENECFNDIITPNFL